MKLGSAAKKLRDGIEETLTYVDFPDGQSALMLVCARLRHVAGTQWGTKRYMNMEHLLKSEEDLLSDIIAGYQTAGIKFAKNY